MSGRFAIEETALPGLRRISRLEVGDSRGYLERMFCEVELGGVFDSRRVAQINRTVTRHRGTVRGLHLQSPPHAEAKLVTCLRGLVFDVAVDLRQSSPTFLYWHGEMLGPESPTPHTSLFIPEGFAHGLQTLSDDCEMLYFHTACYESTAERAVHPLEPRVGIRWPEPIRQISERDASQPMLSADFDGLIL